MMIKKYKQEKYIHRAYCNCGGQLESNTENIMRCFFYPNEEYVHTCNKCGKEVKLPRLYPYEEIVEVEVDA